MHGSARRRRAIDCIRLETSLFRGVRRGIADHRLLSEQRRRLGAEQEQSGSNLHVFSRAEVGWTCLKLLVLIARGTHRIAQSFYAAGCVAYTLCDRAELFQHLSG